MSDEKPLAYHKLYISNRAKKIKGNPFGRTFYLDKNKYSVPMAALKALMGMVKPKYQKGSVRLVKCHTETHWGFRYEKYDG